MCEHCNPKIRGVQSKDFRAPSYEFGSLIGSERRFHEQRLCNLQSFDGEYEYGDINHKNDKRKKKG